MPAKGLDQQRLLEVASAEAQATFEGTVARYPGERFYAFGLYTDNDVTSVFPVANTAEGLDRIFNPQVESRNYYKWAPAEWRVDAGDPRDLAATNALLYPADRTPEPPAEFHVRKRRTIETLTEALARVRAAGVFAGRCVRERVAFWVNIGDALPGEVEWMFGAAIPHLDRPDIDELRDLFEFGCR
jgi:hypothetical protein